MKENKYDDKIFFEKYGQMGRSKDGLIAAGEWETLKKLLPDFKDKRVLDLGCGYGWHCIYAVEQGAKSVIGEDISHKMLEIARTKTEYQNVKYVCRAMEELDYPDESFDVVISSLAFHYVEDFGAVVQKIHDILSANGKFVFSCEHPIFTSYGTQDWIYGENGEIKHFPVDRYFYEGKRDAIFLGETVQKYHRTLTSYLNTLLNCGFIINQIVEPQPSPEHLTTVPDMTNELRRPMMLIVSATKK